METLWQDIRYGVRILFKSPVFTLVAVLALAIGIGANTAIFSIVNAVLLRPLPFKDPDRLVMVWEHNRNKGRSRNVINPANYHDWKDQNTVLEEMAALYDFRFNLTGVDDPEELPAQMVSTNFFQLLGVNPMIGRNFAPEEAQPGKSGVVILSHGLWKRRFGSDPGVIGKDIMLSGEKATIIGVMPPDFKFVIKERPLPGIKAELWSPIPSGPDDHNRRGRYMIAVGRLKDGVTLAQGQAEMNTIGSRLEQQYPDFNTGWGINLVPLQEQLVGEIRPALLVLLGAVAFVLLIACTNVANLLLARAAVRQKEISIRRALGASRWRVMRQLLTESILLSSLGGVIGLLIALWGIEMLFALTPKDLLRIDKVGLDLRLLGFTFGVSILTGIIFGLVPALEGSRGNLNESLKEGGKGRSESGRSHRLSNIFVVAEVALALVLLIGSGLMIKSFMRLQSVDPGFNPENLLTVRLLLPPSKYGEDQKIIAFYRELLQRIEKLPGVRSAGAINFLPFGGSGAATGFTIEGRPAPPPGETPVVDSRVIDPKYFQAMGIPFLNGRNFTERETTEVSRVVIVNETMAKLYFPNEDPIGKKLRIHMSDKPEPTEIIGIVADVKHSGLDAEPRAMAYWPYPELTYSFMTLAIRTESNPLALASAVKEQVKEMDKDQPVADIKTMEELLSDSVARARFSTILLSIFAGVALLLAAVGIYGVMSYSVNQRTHEIGIRMALGAQQRDVLKLIIGQGMLLALIGIGIGIVTSFILTRLMTSLLFGVSASDPITFIAISLLLCGVTLLANYIPARKATRVDPMVALRYE